MTPERWQQVKATLAEALDHPTTTRADFLQRSCGNDAELRAEVASLLDQPADNFETVADKIGFAGNEPTAAAFAGQRLGAYELVRELGRGGMGAVWLARRADEQFEKFVAIKLLKRGTDTDEVLRRFKAERQILARLDHPNIARLLDAGMTQNSLPYFVMEYVEGIRITDYAQQHRLPVRARLELFLKMCSAIQFAHENLIVHRDLKPGNVLVTKVGEPKLLDFGIAKLLDPGAEGWEMTLAGRERLTPGYASPEQVRGEPVTTLSDVYALGALLYETLSERPAHRFGDARPTQTEIIRVVCEEEPLRPSSIATSPDARRTLRGDLDTIVLRALAKTPDRRYHGAAQLADDIRRYLTGRPVRAQRDTVSYRTAKFVSRNKKTVIAAMVVLLLLVTAGIVSVINARRARREARRAEQHFQDVRRLANSLMFEFHNSIRDLPGAMAARQLVIRRAVEYLDKLAAEAGNDLSLKSELATGYQRIGQVTFDLPQALANHHKAVALNESVVAAAPQNVSYRKQLSESYDNLADVLKIAGRSAAAIEYARKGVAVSQSLASEIPNDRDVEDALGDRYLALGIALNDAGYSVEALATEQRALAIQEGLLQANASDKQLLRNLSGSYGLMADCYEDEGNYSVALSYTQKEFELTQELFRSDPDSAAYQRDLWAAYYRRARQETANGEVDVALPDFREAIARIEKLAAADPSDKGHQRWLAMTHFGYGKALEQRHDQDNALREYLGAVAVSEALTATDPQRIEAQRDLVQMYESISRLISQNDYTAAVTYIGKAIELAERFSRLEPTNLKVRRRLAQLYSTAGDIYQRIDVARAGAFYKRSIGAWQGLAAKSRLRPIDATKRDEASEKLALVTK